VTKKVVGVFVFFAASRVLNHGVLDKRLYAAVGGLISRRRRTFDCGSGGIQFRLRYKHLAFARRISVDVEIQGKRTVVAVVCI
jgi:hypothetical protein